MVPVTMTKDLFDQLFATNESLKTLTEELEQSTYKLSEILYQQATAAGAAEGEEHAHAEAEHKGDEETVIDTEFK